MSLSTLQAQLAALNNSRPETAPGLAIASNRHHGDRIGRGIAHSVQQGHSVSHSIKHRPTLIYATTTAAADIPLATLQQNGSGAMQQFIAWRVYPRTMEHIHSVIFPSTAADSDATLISSSIRQVLSLLSCVLAECDTPSDENHMYFAPALHIFEYLIRKYDIHVHYSVELLWSLLPLAKTFPHLVHRCLMLCDWTAVHQSYLWLRPYCVENRDAAAPPNLPSSQVMAIAIMKHVDILRFICQTILPTLAQIHLHQREESRFDWSFNGARCNDSVLRMGLSRILSFTAALVVDGLVWLRKQHHHNQEATEEAVLRTLLPTVTRFLERQSFDGHAYPQEMVSWGYVVASTLVECLPVSTDVVDLLCIKIIRSFSLEDVIVSNGMNESNASADEHGRNEASLNAISCLVSLLFSHGGHDDQSASCIPLLQPPQTWLGCYGVSIHIYDALVQHFGGNPDKLPNLLGWLLNDQEVSSGEEIYKNKMILPIASFMAALFGQFVADSKQEHANEACRLLLSLISSNHLRRIWTDARFDFVASLVLFLLEKDRSVDAERQKFKYILLELHKLDAVAAERGISAMLQRFEPTAITNLKERSTPESVSMYWKNILEMQGNANVISSTTDSGGFSLPPRIALEHADPTVRLRAVHDLVALSAKGEAEQVNGGIDSLLLERFLRQMMHESSTEVKAAIGSAVTKWYEQGSSVVAINAESASRIAKLALEVFYHFYILLPSEEASFNSSLAVLGFVARDVARFGDEDLMIHWQAAVEGMVAILRMNTSFISTEAAVSALLVAFDHGSAPSSIGNSVSIVHLLLRECGPFIERLKRSNHLKSRGSLISSSNALELTLQKKCVLYLLKVLLDFCSDINSIANSDRQEESANDALSLCLYFIESAAKSDAISAEDCTLLTKTLTRSWDMVRVDTTERIPTFLIQIASTESELIWSSISGSTFRTLVTNVRNGHGQIISPFVVIFESVVRIHQSKGTGIAVKRLIRQARELLTFNNIEGNYAPWLAFIPALSLLESNDRLVRVAAADFLRSLEQCLQKIIHLKGNSRFSKSYALLAEICRRVPQAKASAKLDEHNFLASFLASCVRDSSEQALIREALFSLCLYSVLSCSCDLSTNVSKSQVIRWLPMQCNIGGCTGAAIVMDALELSGEEAFPLSLRWKYLGSKLFDAMLISDREAILSSGNGSPCYESLIKSVCRMLKGVIISDPVLILSTGPRSKVQEGSGRTRSYSVGKMEGVSVLTPYPDDMVKALIRVLAEAGRHRLADTFAAFVIRVIFSSATWGECVFKTLTRRNRINIAKAIVDFIKDESTDGLDDFPIGVPLSAGDVVEILKNCKADDSHLISLLLDYVRSHFDEISSDENISNLLSELFALLRSGTYTTACGESQVDDMEYVIHRITITLTKLLQHLSVGGSPIKVNDSVLNEWNTILKGRMNFEVPTPNNLALLSRSKSSGLSLLVALADLYPTRFVETLVQGVVAYVIFCSSSSSLENKFSTALVKAIPCFVRNAASCGLSLIDVLFPVVSAVKNLDEGRKAYVFSEFAKALESCPFTDLTGSNVQLLGGVGALLSTILAVDVFQHKSSTSLLPFGTSSVDSLIALLIQCSPIEQARSLLLLLGYVTELMQYHDGHRSATNRTLNDLLPTHLHIGQLAAIGSLSITQVDVLRSAPTFTLSWESSRSIVMAMLGMFCDGLALGNVREYFQHGDGDASEVSLLLWQNVLLLQALSHMPLGMESQITDDTQFRDFVSTAATESLESLQELLPLHIFLAAATALIKDGAAIDIRCQALRHVTHRVQFVAPDSSEALLFIDVIPMVLEFIRGWKIHGDLRKDDVILIQSSIYAIEHICRLLALPKLSEVERKKLPLHAMKYFNDFLHCCVRILLEWAALRCEASDVPDYVLDLISTVSLCVATLIRVVEARCLSILPKLMSNLMTLLDVSNSFVSSRPWANDAHTLVHHQAVQLSIIRCILAVTETVPQFLPPYLPNLFTGSGILCSALRMTFEKNAGTIPVAETVDRLCTAMSTNVANRLLVPAVLQGLRNCTRSDEILLLMSMLHASTNNASSTCVVSQKDALLSAITITLEHKGVWEERVRLISAACDLFVAMILKLSEVQLRRLYASLMDWRGDIVVTDPQLNSIRRFGFWTVSARLSQELRSIFLPCLDLASDDIIAELILAVDMFQCQGNTKAVSTSVTKKQKLEKSVEYDVESMRSISPLLSTLESALRADAHQGGKWIRRDNNRNFERLLEPLGKMMFSRIPREFPVPDNVTDKYRFVVQGEPENGGGSVIGCLSSLAVAGGNEQLWKPLNHVVISACSDDHRSDVRCAGLVCLLQLMKFLGEEYMILLPENLPIISELLEDSNEEVARLSREVVAQAEELLGESLEESLR